MRRIAFEYLYFRTGSFGARWQLRAFTDMRSRMSRDEALSLLTSSIIKNQEAEIPVHKWKAPSEDLLKSYRPGKMRVEEFMETDLFTVREGDIIELVADIMDWRKIRYMPVEDNQGHLCGLITSRLLLRHFTHARKNSSAATMDKDIMVNKPITVGPDTPIIEAMHTMRDNRIGCLPVVKDGNMLIGIITEMDFLRITGRLMEHLEKE